MKRITEKSLDTLRKNVTELLSPKRFYHTAEVEKMIARMCALYCPEETLRMRAAALLHDVTKELDTEEQIKLCVAYGLPVTDADRFAPKTFHARTAAAKIAYDYPDFNDPVIVGAVRWHTTGHAGMTLTEKLLYLADYIDESRKFENCVILRRYFWGADPEKLDEASRAALLRKTLILSYDMTMRELLDEHKPIAADTVEAMNELLLEDATN